MRKIIAYGPAFLVLATSLEVLAQPRPRGPSYNPPSRSSSPAPSRPSPAPSRPSPAPSRPSPAPSRPSPAPSRPSTPSTPAPTPRGPSYNPPSRPSTPSPAPSRPSTPAPTPRGPSYNPAPSRPSTPSTPAPTPRGPSYNPAPSRPSTPSTPAPTPRGPNYNPAPSRPSTPSTPAPTPRGPSYNPTPSRPSTPSTPAPTPRGPNYNPTPPAPTTPAPRGPSYNPVPRGGRPVHTSGRVISGRTVYHVPVISPIRVVRYATPRAYYAHILPIYIYLSWVLEPVSDYYNDGYWSMNDYPYYVDQGYRYRYSPVESCHYQLVDGNDYSVVKDFEVRTCNEAYDLCANERDGLNRQLGAERYFCAEAVEEDQRTASTAGYSSTPVDLDPQRQAQINEALAGKTVRDIFEQGYLYGGVGQCLIYGLRGNENGCRYIVTDSNEDYFPDVEGNICSASHIAAQVGCNIGDERDNAGCILAQAIRAGACHP